MKRSIQTKLEHLVERHEEIGRLLSEPDVAADPDRFRELSQEFSQLEAIARHYQAFQQAQTDLDAAAALSNDDDPELRELAKEEITAAQHRIQTLETQLHTLLIPADPMDRRDVYLEIRAGAGGDEAALFAGDLFRMYARLAERMAWRVTVISAADGEHGGYKAIIARVTGADVYRRLKFESGAHRVQRVPETESQGRIHTSACTVAIMPEIAAVEAVDINPGELRVDTFRSSGAGGQHVNTTDSAVRLTHLPTGIVVECQDQRSQHKNKARAMNLLQTKIVALKRAQQQAEQASTRRALVGGGDRSEKIRTYNYPQSRLTDHRINLTLYKLPDILQGDLNPVIDALLAEHQADQLAALTAAP